MRHELQFANTTTDDWDRIEIFFRVTRSTFRSVRVARKKKDGSFADLPCSATLPGSGQLWIFFDPKLRQGDSFWLLIEFGSSEPPVIEVYTWGFPWADRQVTALPPSSTPRPPDQLDYHKIFAGLDYLKAIRAWAKFLAAEHNDTLRRYKAFFLEFDRKTNAALRFATALTDEEVTKAAEMIEAGRLLMGPQVEFRLESIIAGMPSYQNLEKWKESPPVTASFLSTFQLDLYRAYFPGKEEGLNQAEVADALCRFANGELRTGSSVDAHPWNCEPDGFMQLHFANHALWSILSEVKESKAWKVLLPCFAASQEFFMRAYHPDREPPYLLYWFAPWNYKHTKRLTPEAIETVFSRYRGQTPQAISALIDVNLRNMLQGNFPRSKSPPKQSRTRQNKARLVKP